mgnify:CR=1 FL=1
MTSVVAGLLAVPAAAETATAPGVARTAAATQRTEARAATTAASGPAAGASGASGTAKPYCARYKCIALTFDDGPWPYTPALLDTLKKHKAKATFFVLGRKVANRMALTRRIQREGHEIGNHTWDHPTLTELSDERLVEEITSTQEIIHQATGRYPTMMRPPSGAVDERVSEHMAELGLPIIKWHVQTLDFKARDVKVIRDRVLRGAKRNAIVLLHDIVPETVQAMPQVLTRLRKQGYRFVTVSRLLEGRMPKPGRVYPASR